MKTILLLCMWLSITAALSQNFQVPELKVLDQSVEQHFNNSRNIQIQELSQTKRFHWLSYLPNPGYSPFAGGFTVSMNLTGPLQEFRLNHTNRARAQAIREQSATQATDLKNSLQADRIVILNRIAEYIARKPLDSLNRLIADLSAKKYNSNEITPTEFITSTKAQQEYLNSRQKEANAIYEAINTLRYKAKMPVTANNEHLISSHP